MKLWLVDADDCDYDEYDAFVVRAADESAARALAEDMGARRGNPGYWLSGHVTVTEITRKGETETILGSFNAG